MPVHLGSMGVTVRAVIRDNEGAVNEGDSFVLNNPYNGGTHLPDITVVTPVFDEGTILFFVACRGHHPDVGGKTPGSAPGLGAYRRGRRADQQFQAGRWRGVPRGRDVGELLNGAIHPARNPSRISPICRRSWRRMKKACRNCTGWSRNMGWRQCWPIWGMSRTMLRNGAPRD